MATRYRHGRKSSRLQITPSRRFKRWRWLILLFGISAIVFGLLGLISYYNVKQGGIPSPTHTATQSPDKPSEEPIPSSYNVPPDQPKEITLPSINAKGFIQPVGVDKTNQIVAPGNIHLAGWYTGSVKPGEPGLSIIDGHVQGVYDKGVFHDLAKLQADDSFNVTYGDNSVRAFKVVKINTMPANQATSALFYRDPAITSQLNVITCGGKYIASTNTYEKRVVVVAEKI